jgi:hypothetical protein
MKTVITRVGSVTTHPDGTLSIGYASAKENHTLEIKPEALRQLFQPLLASKSDDLSSPLSRKIHPGGLRRFKFGNEVGISFLIAQDVSIHFVLDRSLAAALQKSLETFDDMSTWNLSVPSGS